MKRLVVLGGGESGCGSAILAQAKGMDVFLSDCGKIAPKYIELLDKYGIPYEQGQHTEEKILNADEVVKSPGIPPTAPLVRKLAEQGTPIISEIEFAGRYTDAKTVCITGSNGKTTTTLLTYHILQEAGFNVGLAGNVGRSMARQVAEEDHDVYVIELSSFQLENMYDFKADVAIIMNITPDHLDRYDHKMENYVAAKFRILQNQTRDDYFIYWEGDPIVTAQIRAMQVEAQQLPFSEIPVHFPGTGDIFSAVLIGHMLDGLTLAQSTQKAMDSVYNLIDKNRDNEDKNCGIPIERDLGEIV